MDPVRERVATDDPVRALFLEAGHRPAPAGLEARVLDRCSATPGASSLAQPAPLIGKKGWFALSAALVAVAAVALRAPAGPVHAGPAWAETVGWSGWRDVNELITSPWLVMAMAAMALFLGFNNWLNARLAHARVH